MGERQRGRGDGTKGILTQRFSRRSVRSLRAACNPRGLLAIAQDGQHGFRGTAEGAQDGDNDLQPILAGVLSGRCEGRGLLAEFESKLLEL